MCLVNDTKSIAVPFINSLWCHLFHVLSSTKGMTFFQICPSKNMNISSRLDVASRRSKKAARSWNLIGSGWEGALNA